MSDVTSAASSPLHGVDSDPLFTAYRLGPLALRNRFVMLPMTRLHSPGGVPGEDVRSYYARRAASVGLVIAEAALVDEPSAGGSSRVPRLYGDAPRDAWRSLVADVHAQGGLVLPQLWHVGAVRRPGRPPYHEAPVLSPSGIGLDGQPIDGVPLATSGIDRIVQSFARAAAFAKDFGADGVEVHGAHGYLIDQFLWARTNRRADRYGGGLIGRLTFAAEVVSAVRDAVGPDFPVAFRFSQWKNSAFDATVFRTPAELEQALATLSNAGVTMWDVSTRRYWLPAFEGSELTLAGWTKRISGMPTLACGSVGVSSPFLSDAADERSSVNLRRLLDLFEAGEFDLVGTGRAVLSDPMFIRRIRNGDLDGLRLYRKEHELALEPTDSNRHDGSARLDPESGDAPSDTR